ncbi:hypothetical protein LPB67_14870 [Undibacterium sp. Jales W-56]|uniref:hypothetical protein n=1 Tax=Undibacterium sp. Jales W-56 TaxID=2897325 RepID=UPI0021CF7735|nr:hypothetical protein [Undibacterium sp. Jales W-56]MCU6435058.1 hypothetical protein [Undibacterium sp. Jales W-56]
MNQIKYQQSQWIKVLWITLPLITLIVMMLETNGQNPAERLRALLTIAAINCLVLGLLGRLTIRIDSTHLRWHFGLLGWPAWKVALSEIRQVELCQTRWTEGWGIRLTTQGMLYNAAGSGAVRITKADGSSLRLGSAEPDRLYAQLHQLLDSSILNSATR